MTANRLLELMNRTPFQPMEIRLCDGTRISVGAPFDISTSSNSPTCTIYEDREQIRVVSIRNITEVVTTVSEQ